MEMSCCQEEGAIHVDDVVTTCIESGGLICKPSSTNATRNYKPTSLRRYLFIFSILSGEHNMVGAINSPEVSRMLFPDASSASRLSEYLLSDRGHINDGPMSLHDQITGEEYVSNNMRNDDLDDGSDASEDILYSRNNQSLWKHDFPLSSGEELFDLLKSSQSTCDTISIANEINSNALPETAKKRALKTGTTIVGCIADNGSCVVLAADTRATEDRTVADKRCEKVHSLAKNVWCCGAGTSGDIDALVRRARYTFLLRGVRRLSIGNIDRDNDFEYHTTVIHGGDDDNDDNGEEARFLPILPVASVSAVCKFFRDELYRGQGHIGANLVLGGYEYSAEKALLVAIHPHGSLDLVDYTALGSGGLAAMAILDSRYKSDITLDEAVELVTAAVRAGITNDLGSGSQIDMCIIKKGGVEYRRAVESEQKLPPNEDETGTDEKLYDKLSRGDEDDFEIMGVNGFGSVPYKIKSTHTVKICEDKEEAENTAWMHRVLGMQ
mmetsp:Transcript_8172/g.12155  ORF Transcript_8172/g.12155 Transcript_8172/m.12155 type:complete len:496 (-) Transcript_8172:108-1595(-)